MDTPRRDASIHSLTQFKDTHTRDNAVVGSNTPTLLTIPTHPPTNASPSPPKDDYSYISRLGLLTTAMFMFAWSYRPPCSLGPTAGDSSSVIITGRPSGWEVRLVGNGRWIWRSHTHSEACSSGRGGLPASLSLSRRW